MKEDDFVIVEGKTYDEAVQKGLKLLKCAYDDARIETLEEGKIMLGVVLKRYKLKLSSIVQNVSEMAQPEPVKKDGYFELKSNNQDVYLYVYPPVGAGAAVDPEEIAFILKKRHIENPNMEQVYKGIHSGKLFIIHIDALENNNPVDGRAIIEVSQNGMEAFVSVIPPLDGKAATKQYILEQLKSENIVFGILEDIIDTILEKEDFYQKHQIAIGREPVDGTDGKIEYLFNTDAKIKPVILEDGKVDFKELNLIQNVKSGDIVAERIMHTEGVDGITVSGKTLKAKSGKPINFKRGKNVLESSDGLTLIADKDGQVRLIDGKVTVLEVYEVTGNVDNATGNISFKGKVVVKGNVATGFKIECDGDIEVQGVVEGATLIAEGNIILHKGIQGNLSGKLISKQDIIARYMENCYAKAAGNITADAVMHCTLESKNKVVVTGKKGLIVGGVVRANSEVSAKYIGSTMATSTKIEVGVDPELKERYDELKNELESLNKNKENVIKAIELLTKLSKTGPLPADKQEILEKSKKTNAYLDEKIDKINEELIDLKYSLQSLSGGKISVSAIAYPGVKLFIGNSMYYVRDQIQCSTFLRENGEIRIAPYLG